MIISLNPDWRIRSDPLQWIVERLHVRNSESRGEYSEWRAWGYFSTLPGAVNGCLEGQIRSLDMELPAGALGCLSSGPWGQCVRAWMNLGRI